MTNPTLVNNEVTDGLTPDRFGQVHPVETPEILTKKLKEFDEQVSRETATRTPANAALLQAMEESPELLTNDFKLMFLRCDVFHVPISCQRWITYWTKRLEIFGPGKAFKRLTQANAFTEPEDQAALESGVITYLKGAHDEKGRSLLLFDPSRQDKSKFQANHLCRVLWYHAHCALEDSETSQQHGFMLLVDPSRAKLSQFDRSVAKVILSSLQHTMPLRLAAFHICHPPAIASIVLPIVKLFLSDRMKKRLLLHPKNKNKTLVILLGEYGIDATSVPTALGGMYALNRKGWLEDQKAAGN